MEYRELGISETRGNMTRASMRWILDNPAVTCVIPGFKNVAQVEDNLATLLQPSFTDAEKQRLRTFYDQEVAAYIRGSY